MRSTSARARIKAELDEARRLREEAAGIVAQYQKKRHEAEAEAEAIIAGARAEAERVAAEAKAKMEEFVARRTKMAETKIAQAEAQALADVRAAAADAAVAAAEKILSETAKGSDRRDPDRPGHPGREGEVELTRYRCAASRRGLGPHRRILSGPALLPEQFPFIVESSSFD